MNKLRAVIRGFCCKQKKGDLLDENTILMLIITKIKIVKTARTNYFRVILAIDLLITASVALLSLRSYVSEWIINSRFQAPNETRQQLLETLRKMALNCVLHSLRIRRSNEFVLSAANFNFMFRLPAAVNPLPATVCQNYVTALFNLYFPLTKPSSSLV